MDTQIFSHFSLPQHTPLNAPGIYIRTLIPDGPAASDGRLRIGDRILAVNGTSLIGADYQRYVRSCFSCALCDCNIGMVKIVETTR